MPGDALMITVRTAQAEHGTSIQSITEKTRVFNKTEIETVGELWEEYLSKGEASGYAFLVALEGEVVTGYACFGAHALTEGAYDIYWIAVDPDYQKRGIGQALLGQIEADVEILHGNLLILETSSTSPYQPARSFYTSNGYELEATIRDFYAPDDHLVIYTKHIRRGDPLRERSSLQAT